MNEELKALIANMAAVIRVQNGNRHEDINKLLAHADEVLSRPAPAVQVPDGMVLVHADMLSEVMDKWAPRFKEIGYKDEVTLDDRHRLLEGALTVKLLCQSAAPAPATVATEAVAQGGAYCLNRLYAGTKCRVCGRESEFQAEPVAQGGGVDAGYEIMAQLAYTMFDIGFTTGEREKWLEQFRALLSASPAGVGGWQPIETAPKDGGAFIATGFNYGKDGGPRHYCMALWEQGEWREASEWNGHSSLAYLTHWQPLPAAPTIAKQGEGE